MWLSRSNLIVKLWTTALLPLIPLVAVIIMLCWQANGQIMADAETALTESAASLRNLCQNQHELVQASLDRGVTLASHLLGSRGKGAPVRLNGERLVDWRAVDQMSGQARELNLPELLAGDGGSLVRDEDLVDKVKELSGATCTIFQRMSPAGEFLRVATNVRNAQGQRAVGTFIPADSPVAQALAKGQPYRGRAVVVGRWQITNYQPIKDQAGQVVGALYVGLPKEFSTSMGQTVGNIMAGRQGYGFVMEGDGNMVAHPSLAGRNVITSGSEQERLVFGAMAQALKAGKTGIMDAQLSDSQGKRLLVRYTTYAPWDWVLGVVVGEQQILAGVNRMRLWGWGILAATLLFMVIMAWVSIRSARGPLIASISVLRQGVEGVSAASGQLSQSAQSLASSASQQAASLEETSASMEEMAAMTRSTAENASQADHEMKEAQGRVDKAGVGMEAINASMAEMAESGDQISKIIRTIDEIAFQTNLLALNAAVEAARAGGAGAGFAVVAEEVRNLAQRAAQAAKDTQALIEKTVASINRGAQQVSSTLAEFKDVTQSATKVASLLSEISAASAEQAQGINQVTKALGLMDKAVQANAGNSGQTASAAGQLEGEAHNLANVVQDLSRLAGL